MSRTGSKVCWFACLLYMASGFAFAQEPPHVCAGGPGVDEVLAGVSAGGSGVASAPLCYWKSGHEGSALEEEYVENRWGAIAIDERNAKVGGADGKSSERKAVSAALKACKKDGGVSCVVEIAYVNQCAIIVTGTKGHGTASADTEAEAKRIGLEKCRESDDNCEIYYTGCSYPATVRYLN